MRARGTTTRYVATHPGGRVTRRALALVAAGSLLTLAACDSGGGDGDGATGTGGGGFLGIGGDEPETPAVQAVTTAPSGELVVTGEDAAELAAGTTALLFGSSPVVVLTSPAESVRAASAAVALGVPVVVDGPDAAAELDRLGAEVALALGQVGDPGIDVVVPTTDEELATLLGVESGAVTVSADEAASSIAALDPNAPALLVPAGQALGADAATSTGSPDDDSATGSADEDAATSSPDDAASTSLPPLTSDRDELPPTTAPTVLDAVTLLAAGEPEDLAALGTARAAGVHLLVGPHTDPGATTESMQAMGAPTAATVIGLGDRFGDEETFAWKVRTARTGVELPGGGQVALPGKTYVALYGTPSTGALGVLGEQPIEQTVERAEEHAGWYTDLTDQTVVPTLEIIATIASAGPGADGDYSEEIPVSELEPLVDLAAEHGQYVVLDLQPGQTDFLTQAKIYEDLLLRPNVGLALDPEWRLGPGEKHLVQIGHVDVEEVNGVVEWLADLTRDNDLPQKILVLHQFQIRMITDVDSVDQSRDEVAVLIHADGQGAQPDKQTTWRALHQNAPSIRYWGWKNFYDEDVPMLTAAETMSQVSPLPDFISYQ